LVTIFIGSVAQAGGIDNTIAFLSDIPGFLSATTVASPVLDEAGNQVIQNGLPLFGEANTYGIITIVSGLAWGLGYFGMPQVLIRFMSVRHSDEIKKSRIIAMVWLVVSLSAAVCIGLIGRAVLPTEFLTQASAENVFIILSRMILPSFFCGLVVSGIFAAAMSSSSSYLLMSGSAVANNIFKGLLKRDATDNQVMIVARITLVAVLIFGCAISLDQNSSIFNIVSYAWAGLGASFGPLMLLSLYWRRTTLQGAAAGMITGGLTVILWDMLIAPLGGWFAVYELLPGFVLSFIVIVVVSKLTKEPSEEIYEEFDHYMEADF
ncbi:MAG: sodium:proline symporter, partial [Eggerthellaceae bacterium]|nr:sodium:proline symporter [Eggerthellaceae bacterium]